MDMTTNNHENADYNLQRIKNVPKMTSSVYNYNQTIFKESRTSPKWHHQSIITINPFYAVTLIHGNYYRVYAYRRNISGLRVHTV